MFVICYIYAFLFTIYIQFVTERLHMGGWVAGAQPPCHECAPSLYKKSEQAMYSLLRHESKDHVLIPNAHPANLSL